MFKAQPAKKGYFFDAGYKAVWDVIQGTFDGMADSIKEHVSGIAEARFFGKLYHLAVIPALVIVGFSVCIILSLLHAAVVFSIMLMYYLLFPVVKAIDWLYLKRKEISISCRECKASFMYPVYICPNCNAGHDRLTPGVYGAFRRTCNCGYKLPASVLAIKNKRKDLTAQCPHCNTRLMAGESRPICIPVVGGPQVGKSTFITAYANLFIESISAGKNVKIELYNEDVARAYSIKRNQFNHGQIIKTPVEIDRNKASSIAFSFFIKHKALNPDRLIHIYDIAGESFIDGVYETQKQYEYCDGIILMLDPFAIDDVMARYGLKLNSTDQSGTSRVSVDSVMDSFNNMLVNTIGFSAKKIIDTPLAVVLSKADEADLDDLIGDTAIKHAMISHPGVFTDYFDTMDYLCRQFLRKFGMSHTLQHIQTDFKTNRFFSASAVGRSINTGAYTPENVVPVLDWIYGRSDNRLSSIVGSTRFGTAKLPIETNIETW